MLKARSNLSVAEVDILMADDDPDDQLLIVMAAEEARAKVEFTFVDNGLELMTTLSLRQEQGRLPDLVLLDLRMPRMDGHQVLDKLQSDSVLWTVPVIVFSSSARVEDVERSSRSGAVRHQVKPSKFADLVEFVKSLESFQRDPDAKASQPGLSMTDLAMLCEDIEIQNWTDGY